jgi:hypothetical protein
MLRENKYNENKHRNAYQKQIRRSGLEENSEKK